MLANLEEFSQLIHEHWKPATTTHHFEGTTCFRSASLALLWGRFIEKSHLDFAYLIISCLSSLESSPFRLENRSHRISSLAPAENVDGMLVLFGGLGNFSWLLSQPDRGFTNGCFTKTLFDNVAEFSRIRHDAFSNRKRLSFSTLAAEQVDDLVATGVHVGHQAGDLCEQNKYFLSYCSS